ncbi:ral GTPase-activating protein subunit beta-like [Tubulanus polymorphus]|uniref:ral GTPase-activating protein subunit beta-like n=1 Tax=Tubulanus polymorphus TaxID=672921 RepID=UPI003DA1D125
MYSEWKSLQTAIQTDNSNNSVLHSFPSAVGREVACSVVKHLAQSLSLGVSSSEPSQLTSDKEVQWTMEVMCYGLNLPLTEHDTIRDCVNVYCEWLYALHASPKPCVPTPVHDDPNKYCQTMLHHLYNLFIPRSDAGMSNNIRQEYVKRQTVLCHRVLRTLQTVAPASNILSRETWEVLLKFLLAINDTLLAPPKVKDDIGDQLCERVLSVLFEMWLIACAKCFPAPSLWKTFRDMCTNWRHHEALVMQWHRVNAALTSRLMKFIYGPDYPELMISEDDKSIIPIDMEKDAVAQSWFRFLHILSNPVDLAKQHIIGQTPKFLHMALTSEAVIDPGQHECLNILPSIFFRAMRGTAILVDAFLGVPHPQSDCDSLFGRFSLSRQTSDTNTVATPPTKRQAKTSSHQISKSSKASTANSNIPKQSSTTSLSSLPPPVMLEAQLPFAVGRPKCNSILHLFGPWLFEAALTGVRVHGSHGSNSEHVYSGPYAIFPPSRRTSFINDDDNIRRRSMPVDAVLKGAHSAEVLADNETGRAEACGTLCRIFCAHKTGEEILPVYLSRFYIALYYGLRVDENFSGQVLASILFNSCNLLRVDLDGVMILVPQLLTALELVLADMLPKFKTLDQIPSVELRKAAIHHLFGMVCLPLHFKNLEIKKLFPGPEVANQITTFMSLKLRITEILLRALTIESDPANTHMLLGALLCLVQDLATCETAENTTLQEDSAGACSGNRPSALSIGEESGLKAKDYDTSHGLFGHVCSLVCNRLMATWKTDLNIALSAMEVLCGLAKLTLNAPNNLMCKRTVKWICDFIVYQCSRPAPAHSRDLHSMIVAAFQCLTLWLVGHSYLLLDKECLHCVLEVVELGISGSKSQPNTSENVTLKLDSKSIAIVQNRASDVPKLKAEKELMPASMRVRDGAEAVLTTIIEQVGAFPPPCGPESTCCLMDEESLLRYCKGGGLPEHGSNFRYFVLENSIIVAVLEQPLGNEQDPLPTVTAVIRGPFGRHAWTMQLRHLPRYHKVASKCYLSDPGRPMPVNIGKHYNIKHRFFPEIVDSIELTQADRSIPSLDSVVLPEQKEEHEKLKKFIEIQAEFELNVSQRKKEERQKTPYPDPETECKPPSICHEFQTARLFLTHYGFLSLEMLKEPMNSTVPPSLVMLDSSQSGFFSNLESLDSIPNRTNDTAYIFYVKSGQKTSVEIVSNVVSRANVQPYFIEFLYALGWAVDVKKHAGWTGNAQTSWKTQESDLDEDPSAHCNTGGGLYDGRQQVLYWADCSSEIVFMVPSPDTYRERRRPSLDSTGPATSVTLTPPPPLPRTRRPASPSRFLQDLTGNQSAKASYGITKSVSNTVLTPTPSTELTIPRRKAPPRPALSADSSPNSSQSRESSPPAIPNRTLINKYSPDLTRPTVTLKQTHLLPPPIPPRSPYNIRFSPIPSPSNTPPNQSHAALSSHGQSTGFVSNPPSWSSLDLAEQLSLHKQTSISSVDSAELPGRACKSAIEASSNFNQADRSPVLGGSIKTFGARDGSQIPKPKSLSLDLDAPPKPDKDSPSTPTESRPQRKYGRHSMNNAGPDTKICIIWVENFEDCEKVPMSELLSSTILPPETGPGGASHRVPDISNLFTIYIHNLKNGLFRISMRGNTSRMSLAGPLVDGMIVSRRTLGSLVRQTSINICKRKRLESDVYQPPHVRRKLKIQELTNKYRCRLTEPEFYTSLFLEPGTFYQKQQKSDELNG